MTIEIMTLITIWCGNQVSGTGLAESYSRSPKEIDRCRERNISCFEKKKTYSERRIADCLKVEKLSK